MRRLEQDSDHYLDKQELAEYIGVSVSTINLWVCQKRIPHIKLGRRVLFNSKDIDRWMGEHKIEPLSEEKNLDF